MSLEFVLILLVLVAGFYMSWTIGANDVSNAMGTSVGSGALTLKKAVLIAAFLEFGGAAIMGGNVSETLQKGIIDINQFALDPNTLLIGMFSALLATAIWLQVASFFGWPVSTTHAIVGAIVGFGMMAGGPGAIHWGEIASIASSWVLSPGLSALIAFLIFSAIQRKILYAFHPVAATKRLMPYLVFIVLLTFFTTIGYSGLKNAKVHVSLPYVFAGAFVISTLASLLTAWLVNRMPIDKQFQGSISLKHMHQVFSVNKALKHLQRLKLASTGEIRDEVSVAIRSMKTLSTKLAEETSTEKSVSEYQVVEKMFAYMQILSACFVAFAHGANDVANAIGPVASAIDIIMHPRDFTAAAPVPFWLLGLGGAGIVIGLATWGWRVIETIGKKITALTPSRGFCAEFGAAATILIASKLGMPVSTTHCIVGAVFGVGLAKGISALNLRMLKDIIISWVVTLPSSAISCVAIYLLLRALLGSIQLV